MPQTATTTPVRPQHSRATPNGVTGQDTGWDTMFLPGADHDVLADATRSAAPDPYTEPGRFSEHARAVWARLTPGTRDRVGELQQGESARPELYLRNLPTDPDLPPTPTDSAWVRRTNGHASELLMSVFAAGLGSPTSYLDQRAGAIYHDIYPTRANAAKVSSQSHAVSLGFHSEMFFHPMPPDFLILLCMRPDPAGTARTGVASFNDIDRVLTAEDRAALRQPHFAVDVASLHGSYTYGGRAITEEDARPCVPIVSPPARRVRFEPALMTPTTSTAAAAMHHADHAAEATARYDTLTNGGMLLLDNRRAAHSRSPFDARFDGSDRWLRRMMVASPEAPTIHGAVRLHNLDLRETWREHDVNFEIVAYRTDAGDAR